MVAVTQVRRTPAQTSRISAAAHHVLTDLERPASIREVTSLISDAVHAACGTPRRPAHAPKPLKIKSLDSIPSYRQPATGGEDEMIETITNIRRIQAGELALEDLPAFDDRWDYAPPMETERDAQSMLPIMRRLRREGRARCDGSRRSGRWVAT